MVYFPDEVFRNIASYLIDPYKADREKHASVWQMIRVVRSRVTQVTYTLDEEDEDDEDEFDYDVESIEDEYFVYDGKGGKVFISTNFEDDHLLHELDNVHEEIEFERDGEYDGTDHEYHNYAFEQYE